ncbi:MAG: bis(5'-nucleosyl)-tetraphosphatase (symmetrical) YqeK [Clostridiales bacterium]|jgi:predicted HD superfamily hydrolase involved in NAD metabolism|nr:bis(5'-nucleosyl)-tetraphosphatase (symmetrical) YqeK [Clostridiales bacterium]
MLVELAEERLAKKLTPQLFEHCAGVAETAARLATQLNYDPDRARLAGWLHDCAREWSPAQLLRFAQANSIEVDKVSRCQPILLHGPVGALLAQNWGLHDYEILSAIRYHTLGYPGMSLLAQIVYIADKIEPGRSYPGVEQLRKKVSHNFDEGLIHSAAQSISYVLQKRQIIHPLTVTFYNWLVEKTGE